MDFLPIIMTFLGGAASAGAFKGPIQTLNDLWYSKFGYKSSEFAKIKKMEVERNINAYQNSIAKEISTVTTDNLQEPSLSIIGPALEASKYYIEEEILRDMFAKLIASSMDQSKNDNIHPSFIEIIKQLSPLDAENFAIIYKGQDIIETRIIVNIAIETPQYSHRVIFDKVYIGNTNQKNLLKQSSSLINLERLGLISITFEEWYTGDFYSLFHSTEEYQTAELLLKDPNFHDFDKVRLLPGIVKTTSFGQSFFECCL